MTARLRATVVGARVIGLTTALVLRERAFEVRLVADQTPGVTSLAAGAMWGPYLVEPRQAVRRWSARSLEVFRQLAVDASSGVRMAAGVEAARVKTIAPEWARALPGFRPCRQAELPAGFVSGHRHTAPLIDMPVYMAYLLDRLYTLGCRLDIGTLRDLSDADPGGVVVNCTGYGARSLVPDPRLRAVRGQHVIVANPGITEFFSEDTGSSPDLLCVYPHGDTVVLGGTALSDDDSLGVDETAATAIVSRCAEVLPALADARVLGHRVGIRPTRPTVRVEAETTSRGVRVIHNYGHGGAGVTLSWGCAEEAYQLLTE